MEQRTDEWLRARAGKITASRFSDIMVIGKNGNLFGTTAIKYAYELISQRLTKEPSESISNEAMDWGTLCEPEAIEQYEFCTFNRVHPVGFVELMGIPVGGSPDGLIGDDGIIEVKCPYNSRIHVETMIEAKYPSEHTAQIQGNLWVTGRKWCDFISYDPRMPAPYSIYIYRVYRDEEYISRLSKRVKDFLIVVDAWHKKLTQC